MPQQSKIQYFDSEGRDHLTAVLKCIKVHLRAFSAKSVKAPKVVFFTRQGEGPMLAFNELSGLDADIIAVTFPPTFTIKLSDGRLFTPEIPEKVQRFFKGVEIPVVRTRLPFDEITGADGHNREVRLIQETLGLFGGSFSLAIQAVLQATDAGLIAVGDEVISATSDTALVVTASTTKDFLSKATGMVVNEILCKPRNLSISRVKTRMIDLPKTAESSIPEIHPPSRE